MRVAGPKATCPGPISAPCVGMSASTPALGGVASALHETGEHQDGEGDDGGTYADQYPVPERAYGLLGQRVWHGWCVP